MAECGSDSSNEGLCDYEKKRLENIRKNEAMLRSLGFEVKKKPMKKKVKVVRKRQRHSSGSDSEDEWQPWKEAEETRKKLRRRATTKFKPPPLDPVKKTQIIRSVNREVDQRLKEVLDAENKGIKLPPPKKTHSLQSRSMKSKKTVPSCESENYFAQDPIELPDFLKSDSDDDVDFWGFPAEVLTYDIPSSVRFEYTIPDRNKHLFDSSGDETDFMGFTKEDLLKTTRPAGFANRYPKRFSERKQYEEVVISDEDEYLYCEDCNAVHHGDCPIHGPLMTLNSTTFDETSKNFTTVPVPAEVSVKPSTIPDAGLGVVANQFIPRGVKVGPYEGKKVWSGDMENENDTSYMWEIRKDGQRLYYLDGKDSFKSNWLRFINCARNEDEQNMVAFQYSGQIYYRTFKNIHPGQELLVWYGEEYARELGISVNPGMQPNFCCKGCGSTFVENSSFQIHLKSSTKCASANPQIFKCQQCSQTFNELHLLQYHIRQHIQMKSKTAIQTSSLTETIINKDKSCTCSCTRKHCGKVLSSVKSLKSHLQTHTGDKPYQCDLCGKCFSEPGNLKRHLRTHTGDKPHQCDLKRHIRTHTGDKPYQCEHCGKCFSLLHHLKSHIRTHTGDKPYQCEHCGECFSQLCNLKTHIRTHTGDKPYKCEHCGKCFSVLGNLKSHIRTHTGDKPYQCEHCGECFSQLCNLKTHIRTHTGDKPYKCEHCGKCFSQLCTLKSHRRTHTVGNDLVT